PRCPEHARRRVETSARGDVGREESCEPVSLLLDRRRPYEHPAPRPRSRQPPVVEQLRERTAHRDPADSVELAQVLLRFDRRALRAHALRDLRRDQLEELVPERHRALRIHASGSASATGACTMALLLTRTTSVPPIAHRERS